MAFLLAVLSVFLVGVTAFFCFTQAAEKNGEMNMRIALGCLVIVICSSWGWYFFEYLGEAKTAEREKISQIKKTQAECSNRTMAYVMSQNFVKRRLKAPDSAVFPLITKVKSESIPGCKFLIAAYFDSNNGFGVLVRSTYSAEMEYLSPQDKWRLNDLSIY
ncbi:MULTISPECIES: hypothetical protein [Pseudomonas]|uniref:hypothetical protein n=1 Tax=Pseudomonas TaxID=286 RepID=UPI0014753310|nr:MULTISPECIES: hypothetical protein [Pseudomonas]NNA50460.1 hypothetical protein [Pseudomonas lactis]